MSAVHARAARRERQAAKALGTERVRRHRGESAPDVELVQLPGGAVLQAEVKSRARLPRLVRLALEQAKGYASDAIPLAVVYEKGQRGGIACLPLQAFAELVGLDVGRLPSPTPLRRQRPASDGQITIWDAIKKKDS